MRDVLKYILIAPIILLNSCAQVASLLEDDTAVFIYPSAGKQDVPVDAMISVVFEPEAAMDQKRAHRLVSSGKFAITENCQAQETSASSIEKDRANATSKEEAPKEETPKKKPTASSINIPFYVTASTIFKNVPEGALSKTAIDKKPDEKDKKDTPTPDTTASSAYDKIVVFVIPQTTKGKNTPLKDGGTDYCLTLDAFKNIKGDVIPATQVQFATEKTSGFWFDAIEDVQTSIRVEQKTLGPFIEGIGNDYLTVDFGDASVVNPTDLLAHTQLCKHETKTIKGSKTSEDDDTVEKTSEAEEKTEEVCTPLAFQLQTYEVFSLDQDNPSFITANYNRFVILPIDRIDTGTYRLSIHGSSASTRTKKGSDSSKFGPELWGKTFLVQDGPLRYGAEALKASLGAEALSQPGNAFAIGNSG